jgi:hypothetical protein
MMNIDKSSHSSWLAFASWVNSFGLIASASPSFLGAFGPAQVQDVIGYRSIRGFSPFLRISAVQRITPERIS